MHGQQNIKISFCSYRNTHKDISLNFLC